MYGRWEQSGPGLITYFRLLIKNCRALDSSPEVSSLPHRAGCTTGRYFVRIIHSVCQRQNLYTGTKIQPYTNHAPLIQHSCVYKHLLLALIGNLEYVLEIRVVTTKSYHLVYLCVFTYFGL